MPSIIEDTCTKPFVYNSSTCHATESVPVYTPTVFPPYRVLLECNVQLWGVFELILILEWTSHHRKLGSRDVRKKVSSYQGMHLSHCTHCFHKCLWLYYPYVCIHLYVFLSFIISPFCAYTWMCFLSFTLSPFCAAVDQSHLSWSLESLAQGQGLALCFLIVWPCIQPCPPMSSHCLWI